MDKEKIIEEIYKVQSRLETLFADIQDDLDNLKDEIKEGMLKTRIYNKLTELRINNLKPTVIYINKDIYKDFCNELTDIKPSFKPLYSKLYFNNVLVCPVADTDGRDFLIGI